MKQVSTTNGQSAVHVVGILPAAGLGSRLRPSLYPKELLPILYRSTQDGAEAVPMLLIEYSLLAMQRAGIQDAVVVVSDAKTELLRYLGEGAASGVQLCYVVQTNPLGLAHAVSLGARWTAQLGVSYCMTLPDTLFEPSDALDHVVRELKTTRADLVLGVFPTDRPEELGPVAVREDGVVTYVLDKPSATHLQNTWAIAAWSPAFTQFLLEYVFRVDPTGGGSAARRHGAEVILGNVFDKACRSGLNVRAVTFSDGSFRDFGSPAGLAAVTESLGPRLVHLPDRQMQP